MEKYYFETLPNREFSEFDLSTDSIEIKSKNENYAVFDLQNCWSYGPLKVCLKAEAEKIRVVVYILNIEIISVALTKDKPCLEFKYDKKPVFAELKISTDFEEKIVVIEGKLCYFIICMKLRQQIFSW